MAVWSAIEGPDERRVPLRPRAPGLEAFELLMRQHERLVLATAADDGKYADAQDISQEVFCGSTRI